ncbi:imidazoleglycerol-phosphate dehydratase [Brachybacterium sp. P6-10-X1]|uniref:imidazoleglycerol-phosphate dehydratase HisB n=1 Tax=Brachybacterium sp. P6-10-X1 TaxID=1903186 RepID=UPI0009719F91|nr:imidazoleglycerol-phosphate dehydratase HisB [Brachybacterium sp. P6-10-X1]APX32543.1 imidazoleglycerol-phosphate dehydratase [Brachybacterium sp. P6-10-X1]
MTDPASAAARPSRRASIARTTRESSVEVTLDVDGTGQVDISTSVPFFDHMLTALGTHARFDLKVSATGDTHIDAHHTVEDTAIVLGQALREALGDKRGIARFGDAMVPLDESLAQAVVDLSGRPYCVHSGESEAQALHLIGGHFTGSLTRHVFESFAHHAAICLHIRLLDGRDPHHVVEAQFKALARALRAACAVDDRVLDVPSTKGAL